MSGTPRYIGCRVILQRPLEIVIVLTTVIVAPKFGEVFVIDRLFGKVYSICDFMQIVIDVSNIRVKKYTSFKRSVRSDCGKYIRRMIRDDLYTHVVWKCMLDITMA